MEPMNQPDKLSNGGISRPLIALMKGVVFREHDERLFQQLEDNRIAVRDYVRVLGLELVMDEAEGYAWLKTREPEEDEDPLPRLVGRRQLSYPVSLVIATLRKNWRKAMQQATTQD